MLRAISRRLFLTSTVASVAGVALADAPGKSYRPQVRPGNAPRAVAKGPESLIAQAQLGGRVTYAVADVRTGRMLETREETAATPPASVTKAVTALYALAALGGAHRFQTRLIATGPVSGGVLQGDLILAGGGDPTLDTNGLARLASVLKQSGVREVRGAFRVFDGAMPRIDTIDPAQPVHVGYSPAVSGIALNFNRVHFEWKRQSGGYAVTMDARSDRYTPRVYTSTMRVAERRLPTYAYSASGGKDNWSVARAALGNGGARWLPVRNPGLYAGDVFQTLARANGVPLPAPQLTRNAPRGTAIAAVQSDTLTEICRGMLRFSNNLTAEMVGLAATAKRTGSVPRSLKASASEMNRWAGSALGTKGLRLVDHSGLGSASKVTAEAMLTALLRARQSNALRPILKKIPMLDANRKVIKSHPIDVYAKTGTLNFVSTLAGYMTARDGTEMAFAIFTANEAQRRGIAKSERERPTGGRAWNRRSKALQQKLIERWGALYGS
ncbi:MAG: D-alanyl-D-alanine carboxypeptidase/D-alanyl-D-alanine-endopeptidase [Pseudomonadota bacterium]